MLTPPLFAVLVMGALKGVLVTTQHGVELGRQTFDDDGRTLRSDITFAGHVFSVTLERSPRRALVEEGKTRVPREVPAGTIVLENGDWQAYALAAEQYATARAAVPVKILLPGQGLTVDGTIRVRTRADKTREVEVAIPPLTVSVEIDARGAVVHAAIPLQGLEVRPAAPSAVGGAAVKAAPAPAAPAPAVRTPPTGVVEEPLALARGGVTIRGVLWRPAEATGTAPKKLPLALFIAGSGPTDRDGNQAGLRTDCTRLLAEALARAGVASIRYDKRGIGASDRVSETDVTIHDFVDDAAGLLAEARKDARFSKLTVVGHSEGGLIALLLTQKTPVDATILLATPGRPLWEVLDDQLARAGSKTAATDAIIAALRDGKPVVTYPRELAALFRPSIERFLRSEIALDPASLIGASRGSVTIVQGETDVQVSARDARRLAAARKDARLVLLPRVNHVLKEEAAASTAQTSYVDPTRPLGPGVVDAVRAGIAR